MSEPMVPAHPEPGDTLRARYVAALARVYDLTHPAVTTTDRPGQKPEHVFDWDDGLRLIVSRELDPIAGEVLHLSASVTPRSTLYFGIVDRGTPTAAQQHFCNVALQRWSWLAQREDFQAEFLGFSEGKGVPHWWIR